MVCTKAFLPPSAETSPHIPKGLSTAEEAEQHLQGSRGRDQQRREVARTTFEVEEAKPGGPLEMPTTKNKIAC